MRSVDWGVQGNGMEQGTGALLPVLFTDIEGSTALTEQLGDELWVDVLSAHDAVIRRPPVPAAPAPPPAGHPPQLRATPGPSDGRDGLPVSLH